MGETCKAYRWHICGLHRWHSDDGEGALQEVAEVFFTHHLASTESFEFVDDELHLRRHGRVVCLAYRKLFRKHLVHPSFKAERKPFLLVGHIRVVTMDSEV
jgi:hypothetical protein